MGNRVEMVNGNLCECLLDNNRQTGGIRFSFVIPTYRRGQLLEKAIDSVLNQTVSLAQCQIIVLSNDPDDDLSALIEKYRDSGVSVWRNQKNLGMCGNINQCMYLADGNYIAYLHDDDMVCAKYLATMQKLIVRYPQADCIIPARYVQYGNGDWGRQTQKRQRWKSVVSHFMVWKYLNFSPLRKVTAQDIIKMGRNCFGAPTCGTVFKKDSLIGFGGFDPQWKYAFDFIFYEEFSKRNAVYIYKKPLGIYRMTESASNAVPVQLEFFDAYKTILDKGIRQFFWARRFYREYLQLFARSLSVETQALIREKYGESIGNWNRTKYLFLRIFTLCCYLSSGLELEFHTAKSFNDIRSIC